MMKKLSVLLVFNIIVTALFAQSVNNEWGISNGGTDEDGNYDLILDSEGNVYNVGIFKSYSVDFDPSDTITHYLFTHGSYDAYIQKLDSLGNLLWVKSIGGVFADLGRGITLDSDNNVYVIGTYNGLVDFDPGPGVFEIDSGTNYQDVFILKLNSNGDFVWVKSIGGIGTETSRSISFSPPNGIVISGVSDGGDFDPGVDTLLVGTNYSHSSFVLKIDLDGNFDWVNLVGGASNSKSLCNVIDQQGNIYDTGYIKGNAIFGADSIMITTIDTYDIYVQKQDSSGNVLWVQSIGGAEEDVGVSIDTDDFGNVYVTGFFEETVDFNPGIESFEMTSNGDNDVFVLKLNPYGDFLWAKRMGGIYKDRGMGIDIHQQGFVYTVGFMGGTADFNPNEGNLTLTAVAGFDPFIQKLDSSGNFVWAKNIGGNGQAHGNSIYVDDNENIYIGGEFTNEIAFATDTADLVLEATDDFDIYVAKFSQSPCSAPIIGMDTIIACDSFTWINGQTYTNSKDSVSYIIVGGGENCCDSIVNLNLTINKSYDTTQVVNACDSYEWTNGVTYSNSVFTNQVFERVNGCDSTIYLDLTINNSSHSYTEVTTCVSYEWVDGITYTASNDTATYSFFNEVTGCDSIVHLDLTIIPVDVGLSIQAPDIIANAPNSSANHQWLDCNENYAIIEGEESQIFTAQENGSYAVEIMQLGCIDTSECVVLSSLALNSYNTPHSVQIYPNPTNGILKLDMQGLSNVSIKVISLSGKIVYFQEEIDSASYQFHLEGDAGVYFIEIISEEQRFFEKIFKE